MELVKRVHAGGVVVRINTEVYLKVLTMWMKPEMEGVTAERPFFGQQEGSGCQPTTPQRPMGLVQGEHPFLLGEGGFAS
jgi:hypothetical protein